MSPSETRAYTKVRPRFFARARMCRCVRRVGLSTALRLKKSSPHSFAKLLLLGWSPSRTLADSAFGVAARAFAYRKKPARIDANRPVFPRAADTQVSALLASARAPRLVNISAVRRTRVIPKPHHHR